MRIFVFGNINTGKSYRVNQLIDMFPKYEVFQIDDYRKRYADGTWIGEEKTQDKFVQDVSKSENAIVECTGLGELGKKLANSVFVKQDVILHVKEELDILLDRVSYKDFNSIPYPKDDYTEITSVIKESQVSFENGKLDDLWSDKVMQFFEVVSKTDIMLLPLKLLDYFSNVVSILYFCEEIETIFPYGSYGRKSLTIRSDIDCFIVTKKSVSDIFILLQDIDRSLLDIIGNKITLRFDGDLLIEIVVLETLSQGERYIQGSLIDNPLKLLIKSNKVDTDYLRNLSVDFNKPIDSMDDLVSEMMYYILSLPKLASADNKYKFYFHYNIFLHLYIRVNEISRSNIEFNYLPNIEFDEYKDLILCSNYKYSEVLSNVKRLFYDSSVFSCDKYQKSVESTYKDIS